jgi:segregation and condensation protein A
LPTTDARAAGTTGDGVDAVDAALVAAGANPIAVGTPDPIAKVYGEPLLEIPKDLYIPPDALEVFLETFEGPLDLLLYLIRRQNIDVLDIPMAALTRQYLEYVELMRRTQLELAAEYLLMAAVLIEIKSRMLLPRPPRESGEEPADPRAELVRQLLKYEQMKQAARGLDELPVAGRDFHVVQVWFERSVAERLPEVRPEDLKNAWIALVQRAKVNRHHLVTREQLSVRAQMSRLLRLLERGEYVEFVELFEEAADVPHLVVTLLAILELAKEGLVKVTQAAPYSPIHVRLARGDATTADAATGAVAGTSAAGATAANDEAGSPRPN